jgi:hypothetical protein
MKPHPNDVVVNLMGATRQQAIAKTPTKWSAYQIPSVIVVFIVIGFEVFFVKSHSHKPQEALNLLVTEEHYWALFCMPLVTEERYWALFYMPLYTFIRTLLVEMVQIANKMRLQKMCYDVIT